MGLAICEETARDIKKIVEESVGDFGKVSKRPHMVEHLKWLALTDADMHRRFGHFRVGGGRASPTARR